MRKGRLKRKETPETPFQRLKRLAEPKKMAMPRGDAPAGPSVTRSGSRRLSIPTKLN